MSQNQKTATFEQAKAVVAKLAQVFVGEPWCGVGVLKATPEPQKNDFFVELRIDAEVLRLKPNQLQYFLFVQEVDGVQVRLVQTEVGEVQSTE